VVRKNFVNALYFRALKVRTLIRNDFERAFETCDALLAPVAPTAAPSSCDMLGDALGDAFTAPASLAGVCALSTPCGTTVAGRPVGLQIIGPALGEATILRVARVTEHGHSCPL